MILNKKQENGLKIAIEKYLNHEKAVVISGYAGTGKSTLVKFIIEALSDYGINPDKDVCFASYTGKAAQVLLKKGNKNVTTLHKLLYEHFPRPNGTFFRKKREILEYRIICVDEVSMAPKELMELLFTHDVFIIALGDPFQLPPVDKDQDNGLLNNPDIFLNEIMRQAMDSEIIRLSMKVRNHEPIHYEHGSDAIIMPYKELNTGVLQWADQILVGTNQTRVNVNNQMRALLNRGASPEEGDKVICLRNYWDIIAENGDPLVNGTIGYINQPYETFVKVPRWLGGQTIKVLNADFISDSDADFDRLPMDERQILTGERCLDYKTLFRLTSNPKTHHLVPMEFTYGYAITCHKSQGSEWDKVLILEEKFPFETEEHARWLYTAITRGSEKVVLVR